MKHQYGFSPELIAAQSTSNWKIESPFALVPGVFMLDKRLNKNHYRVALYLMRYADDKGNCWPMQSTISFALRMPEPVVNKAIKGLVRLGWLKILGKYRSGSGWLANVYQFSIPDGFKCAGAANDVTVEVGLEKVRGFSVSGGKKILQSEAEFSEYMELDVSDAGEGGDYE
jgi:Helix-turn-helix domain